jgi:hypothetical protein
MTKPLEYPAKKFIPGLGRDVRIMEDELSRELQEKLAKLEERLAALENPTP